MEIYTQTFRQKNKSILMSCMYHSTIEWYSGESNIFMQIISSIDMVQIFF